MQHAAIQDKETTPPRSVLLVSAICVVTGLPERRLGRENPRRRPRNWASHGSVEQSGFLAIHSIMGQSHGAGLYGPVLRGRAPSSSPARYAEIDVVVLVVPNPGLLLVEGKASHHLSAGSRGGEFRLQIDVEDDTSNSDAMPVGCALERQ